MSDLGEYIDPFTDFGFKKLFGTEANKALLVDFLNVILQRPSPIRELTFIDKNKIGPNREAREAIYDVSCLDEAGRQFIVEVQNAAQKFFRDRSLFYAAVSLQDQGVKGEWAYELQPVYVVSILNFRLAQTLPTKYRHEATLIEKETKEVFSDKINLIFLEMPKFDKQEKLLSNRAEQWLYLINHLPTFQQAPDWTRDPVFEQVLEVARVANLNNRDMNAYQESLKVLRDNQNTRQYAWETGLEEGRQRGQQKGEREKAEAVARVLKARGVDMAIIVEATGLTEAEIEAL